MWVLVLTVGREGSSKHWRRLLGHAAMMGLPRKSSCLKMSFHLPPRSCLFFNPQSVMIRTKCSQRSGKDLSRELWYKKKVHIWGWVCKKCNSLDPNHCRTSQIRSSCIPSCAPTSTGPQAKTSPIPTARFLLPVTINASLSPQNKGQLFFFLWLMHPSTMHWGMYQVSCEVRWHTTLKKWLLSRNCPII